MVGYADPGNFSVGLFKQYGYKAGWSGGGGNDFVDHTSKYRPGVLPWPG